MAAGKKTAKKSEKKSSVLKRRAVVLKILADRGDAAVVKAHGATERRREAGGAHPLVGHSLDRKSVV